MMVFPLSKNASRLPKHSGFALAAVQDGTVVGFRMLPDELSSLGLANAVGDLLMSHPGTKIAYGMLSARGFCSLP